MLLVHLTTAVSVTIIWAIDDSICSHAPMVLELWCSMDLKAYPLDKQASMIDGNFEKNPLSSLFVFRFANITLRPCTCGEAKCLCSASQALVQRKEDLLRRIWTFTPTLKSPTAHTLLMAKMFLCVGLQYDCSVNFKPTSLNASFLLDF